MTLSKTLSSVCLSTFATMMLASSALASGPSVPAEPTVTYEPAPHVHNWEGFYGGLQLSSFSGGATVTPLPTFPFSRTNSFGAFAGYNWQRGNFVFGGELNYSNFSARFPIFPAAAQSNSLELRARAGYAMDNVLIYGFVGGARSSIRSSIASLNQTGYSYGIGAQYMFSNGMFAGLEAAQRRVSGTIGGIQVSSQLNSVSLRAGFQF